MFQLLKLDNDVPDHTTISRRKAKLGKVALYKSHEEGPIHILIDSSGLAVHVGKLRRPPKNRDYRKLHLCVDEQTGEVVASELMSKRFVRCVASPAACRPNREAHLIGQSGTAHTTRAASMKRWRNTVLIARRGC